MLSGLERVFILNTFGFLALIGGTLCAPAYAEGTWADRAKMAAHDVIEANASDIALAILQSTHPTGAKPRLESQDVAIGGGGIHVSLTVRWVGGFSNGEHVTVVGWDISKAGHGAARVMSDNAPFAVTPVKAKELNAYFEKKLYPVFQAAMADTESTATDEKELAGKFVCETDKAMAVVIEDSVGTLTYASWIKPKLPSKENKPDIVVPGGVENVEGSGQCSHTVWKFTNGDYGYELSTLGCTEREPPAGTSGQLTELINGLRKKTSWCRDPRNKNERHGR